VISKAALPRQTPFFQARCARGYIVLLQNNNVSALSKQHLHNDMKRSMFFNTLNWAWAVYLSQEPLGEGHFWQRATTSNGNRSKSGLVTANLMSI